MKLALVTALSACAALAVGCSTATSDDGATVDAVHVGTAPAVADPDYLVFPTRAEADAWYQSRKAQFIGPNAPDPAPATDPRAVRIQAIIDRHWPTIQQKYGVTMRSPLPMVLDNNQINAFALFDPIAKQIPDVIFIFSGILAQTDEDLEAVLAHEMGHMITKNAIPAYARAVEKFYSARTSEPLGINAQDDAAVRSFIEPFLFGSQVAGPYTTAELHGLPLGQGILAQFFSRYLQKHFVATDPACADLKTRLNAASHDFAVGFSSDGSQSYTPAQLQALDTDALAAQAATVACLKPPATIDFGGAFQTIFGAPLDALRLSPQEQGFSASKDAVTGLFATVEGIHGEMRVVTTSTDFPTTRQYTVEEQADDFAMTVLKAEGKDPGQMGASVLKLGSQTSIDACNAQLATGAVPEYGISDIHHTNCYRAYHSRAFKTYLDAGGVGVVPVTAPVSFDREAFDPLRDRILID